MFRNRIVFLHCANSAGLVAKIPKSTYDQSQSKWIYMRSFYERKS
jgi:hypothetical protein